MVAVGEFSSVERFLVDKKTTSLYVTVLQQGCIFSGMSYRLRYVSYVSQVCLQPFPDNYVDVDYKADHDSANSNAAYTLVHHTVSTTMHTELGKKCLRVGVGSLSRMINVVESLPCARFGDCWQWCFI